MAVNEELVLKDKDTIPSDNLIFSIIGENKTVWQKIMNYVNENYQNINAEWRYYNDGKQWLFKLQQKKKTIFWIGILKDTFRITFYFGGKAQGLIQNSSLSEKLKTGFLEAKQYGSIKPVTIIISGISDLDDIYRLIDLKTKL